MMISSETTHDNTKNLLIDAYHLLTAMEYNCEVETHTLHFKRNEIETIKMLIEDHLKFTV